MISPRVLLICCEGKTERNYFEFITNFYKPAGTEIIEIHHVGRQHRAIIDKGLVERAKYALRLGYGFKEEEIELWVICDNDRMSIDYVELSQYAIEKGVNLGFSRPNFEAYIIQHFGFSSENKVLAIQSKLDVLAGGKYDKTDIGWLEEVIFLDPNIVDAAVINADVNKDQNMSPFFTVQELTKRLIDLKVK